MKIRYFAGAAEAAGVHEETIDAEFEVSVADLVEQLGSDRERLAKVLAVSTLLLDGRAARSREEFVAPGAQVDVLPPFAGG
ncbi:MAG: MoaD/ThiS family protein [Micropruina sp.]|uniref:MoaD/ThiS family protein n=1 Tax=Micropruina sp. TaxID=2737536 RepID=UPI0039E709DD